jgi:hypothetical protein
VSLNIQRCTILLAVANCPGKAALRVYAVAAPRNRSGLTS